MPWTKHSHQGIISAIPHSKTMYYICGMASIMKYEKRHHKLGAVCTNDKRGVCGYSLIIDGWTPQFHVTSHYLFKAVFFEKSGK